MLVEVIPLTADPVVFITTSSFTRAKEVARAGWIWGVAVVLIPAADLPHLPSASSAIRVFLVADEDCKDDLGDHLMCLPVVRPSEAANVVMRARLQAGAGSHPAVALVA